jgi:hypothetical protein
VTQTSEPPGDPVLAHAASSPGGVLHALDEIADLSAHPLARELGEILARASDDAVSQERGDPHFQLMYAERPEDFQDKQARLQVVGRHLERRIDELRLRLLAAGPGLDRPAPYNHQALADIELTEDQLVPLSEFEVGDLALTRNGHTFAPVPPINGQNAAYWFMQTVVRRGLQGAVSVRLDPLMHRPSDAFSHVAYKMWLYGRRLDLSQLPGISQEQFGRWLPGRMSRSAEFTDYVWSPRDGELHLTLEELPKLADVTIRGSRYLHAIYDPAKELVVHLDGAVRVFDPNQWRERASRHVRHSGKAGVRVKTFHLDREVEVEDMTCLAACYFVWNYDVAKFCGVPVPDQLLA